MKGRVGMRDVYWKHIFEAKERLKEQNPGDSKKEILAKARKEYQPEYIIHFDNELYETLPKLSMYHQLAVAP